MNFLAVKLDFKPVKLQNFQVFHSLENKFLVIEMDTTKAAEVMDCYTTGMVNEQFFLRIRLADKIWEEKQAKIIKDMNVFLMRQRMEQLLTQVPGGKMAIPGGNLNPSGKMANPGGYMASPGGNVADPDVNMANPGGSMNPSGNLAILGVNMAIPSVNLAAQRPLMVVPHPIRMPTVETKGDQGMMPYWVLSAVGPQLVMVPIGGQPLEHFRMVNDSYPGQNLQQNLGSSYNPNIQSLGSSVNTSPDLSPELPRRTQNPTPLNPNANIFQPRQ